MSQQQAPWLEGKYGWNFGESGWNTGMDQNLLKFSYMFDRNVDSIVDTLPAAVAGKAYYLNTDKRIYFAVGNPATFLSTPVPQWFEFTLRTTGQIYRFDGAALAQITSAAQVDQNISTLQATTASQATAINNKADKGSNSDITSLSGLTTALSVTQGGTGGKTQADARTGLGLGNVATRNSRALVSEISPSGTPTIWDDGYVWGFETGITAATGNGNKFNYYRLAIWDDQAVQSTGINGASGSKVNGLNVQHIFGGAQSQGGRHAIEANLLQGFGGGGATAATNADRNYVGLQGQVLSDTADGGTSTADPRGAYFGISSSAGVLGGQYVTNLSGCEFNTYIAAGNEGTRVAYHSGIQICSDLRQRGYNIDAAVSISNLGGTVYGWKYGMFLHGGNGRHPLDADSTLIKVESWGGGMAYGLDLRGHTFSGAVVATDKTLIGDGSIVLAASAANMTLGLNEIASIPSVRFRSSGTASAYDAGISAIGGSATAGSGILVLEGANVVMNGTLTRPASDNTQALGSTAFRFTQISAVTGTINTSDEREKNIQGDLDHGLDVLEKLRTISYTWKDGGGTSEMQITGYDEVEEPETEEYEETEVVVEVVDGKAVRKTVTKTLTRPVLDTFPLYDEEGNRLVEEYEESAVVDVVDEDGNPVLDEKGNTVQQAVKQKKTKELTYSVPRTKRVKVPKYEEVVSHKEGTRTHYGLSAQQVKSVIDEMNLGDFAGWVLDDPSNPDSRQGLRYDQFIPLLINAVKELSARVKVLEAK